MLKAKLVGVPLAPAPSPWSASVMAANQVLVEAGSLRGLRNVVPVPTRDPEVFTPLRKPLSECIVALCTADGVQLRVQDPFVLAGDANIRLIPARTPTGELMVCHGEFDNSDINRDINVMCSIDWLRDLKAEGFIGGIAPTLIGFMGGVGDVDRFRDASDPAIARILKGEGMDVAMFTGDCGTCHRSAVIVQRAVEAAGIATVIIAALPPIALQEGAPRITAPHVAIGANAGGAWQRLHATGDSQGLLAGRGGAGDAWGDQGSALHLSPQQLRRMEIGLQCRKEFSGAGPLMNKMTCAW